MIVDATEATKQADYQILSVAASNRELNRPQLRSDPIMEMVDSEDRNSPISNENTAYRRESRRRGFTCRDLEFGLDDLNTEENDDADT